MGAGERRKGEGRAKVEEQGELSGALCSGAEAACALLLLLRLAARPEFLICFGFGHLLLTALALAFGL